MPARIIPLTKGDFHLNEQQRMVLDFQNVMGQTINGRPTVPSDEDVSLRKRLVREEDDEFSQASDQRDAQSVAHELSDILYVVYGAANTWGIDLEPVFAEIHRANMTKVWPDGTVRKREDGKILKPPGWTPADISHIMASQSAPTVKVIPMAGEMEIIRPPDQE